MDASSAGKLSADAIAARLREAGLRVTRPRVAVYRLLREAGGHHAADSIHAQLAKAGVALPRASVFNVLHDLEDAGLLLRADAGPGRALYEASDSWHHHFVCRGCGAIVDVPCAVGAKPCLEPELRARGYAIDEAQVIFRGWCPDCAAP